MEHSVQYAEEVPNQKPFRNSLDFPLCSEYADLWYALNMVLTAHTRRNHQFMVGQLQPLSNSVPEHNASRSVVIMSINEAEDAN